MYGPSISKEPELVIHWFEEGEARGREFVSGAFTYDRDREQWSSLVTGDPLSSDDEVFSEALEAEVNARQYSPFEVTAKAINDAEEQNRFDDLWTAFENGIERGILDEMVRIRTEGDNR